MRSNRPITFAADLNLHTCAENEIGPMMMDGRSADKRKLSMKKQKILMNDSPPSTLAKHRNGHRCGHDNSEDYNKIEWPWLADGDDDVENGHGKF